jgi:hypothetical protein
LHAASTSTEFLHARRWGNSRSPACGTLRDYQLMRRHTSSSTSLRVILHSAFLHPCRWGNSRSPAYGTLSDYQFMRRHTSSTPLHSAFHQIAESNH